MPIKLNLVINRGQYNQVHRPNIKINNGVSHNSSTQSQAQVPPPPPPPVNPVPQGVSMRRALNAPKTGCKSCRG
jgi:hypothetical protein